MLEKIIKLGVIAFVGIIVGSFAIGLLNNLGNSGTFAIPGFGTTYYGYQAGTQYQMPMTNGQGQLPTMKFRGESPWFNFQGQVPMGNMQGQMGNMQGRNDMGFAWQNGYYDRK